MTEEVPEGWKLAPREPTIGMINATIGIGLTDASDAEETWVAMYDAAPTLADDESCLCPEHGRWYSAEDIDRMVKELDWAMNGGDCAKQARLCDIFHQLKERVSMNSEEVVYGEYVNDPPYKEMRLRILLTGTASPDEQQWSAALDQLMDHLDHFPVPTEPLVDIEVDLPDNLLLVSALAAHKKGITLNQYINEALKALLDSFDAE